jgi:hypothetical protein
LPSSAATLADKAKESGCINKPAVVEGETYRCMTKSGAAYFNVPGVHGTPDKGVRQSGSPSGFPKVDTTTQKGRDDLRRKVLTEELATEADRQAATGRLASPEEHRGAQEGVGGDAIACRAAGCGRGTC